MPRPKKIIGDPVEYDVRVTPIDGKPIEFSPTTEDFIKFLACLEGGVNTDKRLHYHVYCVTLRSETYLRSYFGRLARGTGNAAYSIRKAHEGTIGYVIKEGQVVCRHGFDEKLIDEYYAKSKQYRTKLDIERKRAFRQKENFLVEVMKEVSEAIKSSPPPLLEFGEYVIRQVLTHYSSNQIRFPPRSTLDNCVLTLMYKYYPDNVVAYYSRSFDRNNF